MAEDRGGTPLWQRLESPERLARLDPPGMIARLGLRHGMHVADLGCGTGVFTVELAHAVGPAGRVYALDASTEMLDLIRRRGLPPTVRVMHADLRQALPLPEGSLDCCFIAFVLHEVEPEAGYAAGGLIAQMRHLLRHGGTIAVVEFKEDAPQGIGPPPPRRIGSARLAELLAAHDFHAPEVRWESAREYLMVATRPDPTRHV